REDANAGRRGDRGGEGGRGASHRPCSAGRRRHARAAGRQSWRTSVESRTGTTQAALQAEVLAMADVAAPSSGTRLAYTSLPVRRLSWVFAIVPASVRAAPARAGDLCGEGVVDPPETCDDGNLIPGDGCSPLCQLEVPDLPPVCAGAFAAPDALWPPN